MRALPVLLMMGWLGGVGVGPVWGDTPVKGTLVILGDSLAAGYGVEPEQAFPALLQRRIAAAGLGFEVVNAGVSGDTTAGGLRRVGWLLRRPMEVLVIALGGNDGLRGLAPAATRSNLVAMIETVRMRQPGVRIVVAGMQMPPNMGEDYTRTFRDVYPWVAREKHVALIPHLLEGVGGRPEMNLPDLIHPTPEGHERMAENVWEVLGPLLEGLRGRGQETVDGSTRTRS
ncbi:MAG: arylesterase [Verrucomicrobiae bacterium]|nr:arylesterase [Verrucomicrobiae bacterium]